MAGKKAPKTAVKDKVQKNYPTVGVDVCIACTTQCAVGKSYMKKMEKPGAVGKGVVCKK